MSNVVNVKWKRIKEQRKKAKIIMCMYQVPRGFDDIDEYMKYFVYNNDNNIV